MISVAGVGAFRSDLSSSIGVSLTTSGKKDPGESASAVKPSGFSHDLLANGLGLPGETQVLTSKVAAYIP